MRSDEKVTPLSAGPGRSEKRASALAYLEGCGCSGDCTTVLLKDEEF